MHGNACKFDLGKTLVSVDVYVSINVFAVVCSLSCCAFRVFELLAFLDDIRRGPDILVDERLVVEIETVDRFNSTTAGGVKQKLHALQAHLTTLCTEQ